jgi:hypothetical protein
MRFLVWVTLRKLRQIKIENYYNIMNGLNLDSVISINDVDFWVITIYY